MMFTYPMFVYRVEEFVSMKEILPEALACILNPYKSLNSKLDLILSHIATFNQMKVE
jgi:hypothetical protein